MRVDQVVVCTPDKDLAQCVRGDRIVQLDRRTRELRDESAVRQKFGVVSIPKAMAPTAPWVEVWLSPQAMVVASSVTPYHFRLRLPVFLPTTVAS